MGEHLQTKKFTHLGTPLFLLVVCVLAYGLLTPSLGFYWDDLPYALIYQRFGPGGYPAFVASDRPHSAWVFMGLTWLLGEQPLGYHIFGLFLYWLCSVLFWWLLRLIWPDHKKEALWAALLFAVYPGFLGQPKTIIYNHHFSAMLLYLFSLIGTVKAVQGLSQEDGRQNTWLWHIPAVLATVLSQFTIEYYIGWEAVRVAIVWILFSRRPISQEARVGRGLLNLIPYWLASLGFLVWRVLIFRFPTYKPLGGEETSIFSLSWWGDVFSQVIDAVFVVWGRALPHLSSQDYSQPFWLAYLLLTMFSMGLVFLLLYLFGSGSQGLSRNNGQTHPKRGFGLPAVFLSLIGIAFAGWPFWLVNLQLSIVGHFYSRFTLAFIPWVALLVAAGLHMIDRIKFRWTKVITAGLAAVLVGGSIGWHFWNANFYRNQWSDVQRYFQQVVRRAPGLEPGTILLINDLQSLSLYQDDSLTALLNWTYAPENTTQELDFAVFYLSVRLGREFPALEAGYPIEKDFRSLHFSSSTDNFVVVYHQPPGCVRFLDPGLPDRFPLELPDPMLAAASLSNLDLIVTDQATPAALPPHLFDLPVTESWCFYFQEAELAAQQGDWARVAEIGHLAYAGDDRANETTEHFVFIEGFLQVGELETAFALSQEVSDSRDGHIDGRICGIWRGVATKRDLSPYFDQLCRGQ